MSDNKLFDLTGKVALVTGTSRGLGQYMGRALARAGADLVITSANWGISNPFEPKSRHWDARRFQLNSM